VLLVKEETVLQGITDRVIQNGRGYGMEINVEKNKAMKLSKQLFPLEIMADQKQLEHVKYFNCLCSMIKNYVRCICEIKSRTAITKAAIKKRLPLPASWT
jgi:hypothetical protein